MKIITSVLLPHLDQKQVNVCHDFHILNSNIYSKCECARINVSSLTLFCFVFVGNMNMNIKGAMDELADVGLR